ncbi:hypothetical protein GYMLUDRAFT_479602 [Collybiopsis luxurians FD-317 M1]|uniref:Protein SQS1 n=1 Tax=Collybiopsis luxurians FD-317 M1 TaxID=944289 RepID=A0A0D0CJT8_9AGAR|nr:hypothetical protein GYMLUDRAFT_479602 [Collybiopsis luxurians FD-317 M1]
MGRGKHNKNNGNPRGGSWTPRGSIHHDGRGSGGRGRGRGGPRPGRGGYIPSSDTDFILQVWDRSDQVHNPYSSPRGRGRGRGGGIGSTPERNDSIPSSRGWGSGSSANRGRGRGRGGYDSPRAGHNSKPLNPNAPLSMLLRPLLRPVTFVPAIHNRFLFQAEEELIQPIVEAAGDEEQSHIPTADRVARLFSGNFRPPEPDFEGSNENSEDQLPSIDFADIGKFQEEVDLIASEIVANSGRKESANEQVVKETFTGKIKKPSVEEQNSDPMDVPPPRSMDTSVDSVVDDPDSLVRDSTAQTTSVAITDSHTLNIPDAKTDISNISTAMQSITIEREEPIEEKPVFFVDVQPSTFQNNQIPVFDSNSDPNLESAVPDDGDVVVYVAPLPRAGRSAIHTPIEEHLEPAEIRTTSVLTGLPIGMSVPIPGPAPVVDSISFSFNSGLGAASVDAEGGSKAEISSHKPPVFKGNRHTPARLKSRQRNQWAVKHRQQKRLTNSSFASRGADVSEAQLFNWKRDPRMDERRRGDSDVDWGEDDDDDDNWEDDKEDSEVRVGLNGTLEVVASARRGGLGAAEGMDVDPELELDVEAMRRFAQGMGPSGSRHVTMDDLEDERRIREEDEDIGDSSDEESDDDDDEDEDEDEILLDDEESSDDDDDDDQSPKSSFQARLDRLRKGSQSKDKGKGKAVDIDEDSEDEEDSWDRNRSWAEEDDDFIAHIHSVQDILDENKDIINSRDRKARKEVFQAVYNGDFEDEDTWKPARKAKDKDKDLPPELAELWKKDRAKKALFRQERELARLAAAADPLTPKKGGKKGKKAMLAAAKLDPTITVLPNRVIDFTTLVQQIYRFIDDIGGPNTMSLPPANKHTRKDIHELANAFGLKSQSKGGGKARYTTLIKTTMTGVKVNKKKVAKIVRQAGLGGGDFGGSDNWKKFAEQSKARKGMPRHKEGEEVGKTAPKISEANIGFRMLASMGWSEGDSVGLSGGLQNPLTAVIKNTKLGLGATK